MFKKENFRLQVICMEKYAGRGWAHLAAMVSRLRSDLNTVTQHKLCFHDSFFPKIKATFLKFEISQIAICRCLH